MAHTIALSGRLAAGRVALVDAADAAAVLPFTWHLASTNGNGRLVYYARALVTCACGCGGSKRTGMHNLLTGWPRVDHLNHDGLDNQRANLRPVTAAQNSHNTRPHLDGTSPYKGVHWDRPHQRWRADIVTGGRKRFLGYFTDAVEAARTYDAAAMAERGAYAWVNFPG